MKQLSISSSPPPILQAIALVIASALGLGCLSAPVDRISSLHQDVPDAVSQDLSTDAGPTDTVEVRNTASDAADSDTGEVTTTEWSDTRPDGNEPELANDTTESGGDIEQHPSDVAAYDSTDDVDDGFGVHDRTPDSASSIIVFNILAPQADLDRMHNAPRQDIELSVLVEANGHTYQDVELQLHGGYARTVAKKSYRFDFDDDDLLIADLFGDGEEEIERVVLQASWIDPTFLRNPLTFHLIREMGGLAPRTGFAIIEINGQYHGLYQLIERIDRHYLERNGLDRNGNLYKAVNHLANWGNPIDHMAGFEQKVNEDNPTDDLDNLREVLASTPADFASFQAAVEPVLSLDDFMTWQIVQTLADNRDAFTKNYYLYHDLSAEPGDPEDRFRIIAWDSDATWGVNWDGASVEVTTSRWYGTDKFSPRLFAIPEYRGNYLSRYSTALDELLSEEQAFQWLDAQHQLIEAEVARDLEHWSRLMDANDEYERLMDVYQQRIDIMDSVVTN
ncbi:MAG: CotH kinase family protein, partial [Myxococcales bacterium]|nr:CotH kinase family protein [Myxococcales bacterium]